LLDTVKVYLNKLGKAMDFPKLRDSDWLCDFSFAVDIFAHLNNVKLQGKGVFVPELYLNVNAFRAKLTLFSKHMISRSFTHFPTLGILDVSHAEALRYNKYLKDLHGEFSRRFADFYKIETSLTLVSCPLTFNYETAAQELQLELIDLQCDITLKEKFHSVKLDEFYASLNEAKFPHIRQAAQKILVFFRSTYACEQTFSLMNINKSHHRSRLSDHHLRSVLRIATTQLSMDFDALAKSVSFMKNH
uniref:HAT C-terminal dimerisation domain-containing protein n=1 Tax=Lepisosteus oculatus TaxID=7918 RepID=W5LW09_LEPOC